MAGDYLETPWGEVYYELVYDPNLRAKQRWTRPWYDYSPQPPRTAPYGSQYDPKNKATSVCPSC